MSATAPIDDSSKGDDSTHLEPIEKEGANVKDPPRELYEACTKGDLKVTKLLVENGADIHGKASIFENTPLYGACNAKHVKSGHLEVVKYLINKGADPLSKNNLGSTPLHAACSGAGTIHFEVVKFMINKGADPLSKDNLGSTPLHAACSRGNIEVVKFLIEKIIDEACSGSADLKNTANVNTKDDSGMAPLHIVSMLGNLESLKCLIENGADLNGKEYNHGWTALHCAFAYRQFEVVKFLVEKGADVQAKDKNGNAPPDLILKKEQETSHFSEDSTSNNMHSANEYQRSAQSDNAQRSFQHQQAKTSDSPHLPLNTRTPTDFNDVGPIKIESLGFTAEKVEMEADLNHHHVSQATLDHEDPAVLGAKTKLEEILKQLQHDPFLNPFLNVSDGATTGIGSNLNKTMQSDDLLSKNGVPMFGKNGMILGREEREDLARKSGRCISCGIKVQIIKVFKKPVTNSEVWKGICIRCFPSQVPSEVVAKYQKRVAKDNPTQPLFEQSNRPQLRPATKDFLQNTLSYIDCRAKMDAMCRKIDESQMIAQYPLQACAEMIQMESDNPNEYKQEYQQHSVAGKPVKSLDELYDVAELALPVFREQLEKICKICGDNTSPVQLFVAALKDRDRALEKARDDYSERTPGPGVSWLYDIVRGSLVFESVEQIVTCLDLIQNDPTLQIVKAKNRFQSPSLSGYRDVNIHIRIPVHDGLYMICKVQLHHKAMKDLDKMVGSHDYYEYFRSYFAGSTDSVKDRVEDLKKIIGPGGGMLNVEFLQDLIHTSNSIEDESRLERLGTVFRKQLCEYSWALQVYCKLLQLQLDHFGVRHLSVMKSCSALAIVLSDMEYFDTAEQVYGLSVDLLQSLDSRQAHSLLAQVYNNMSTLLTEQERLGEAKELHMKSLELYKKLWGKPMCRLQMCISTWE